MRTLLLAVLILPLALLGQKDTSVASYQRQAIYSVSGSFTELENWNAGGENSSNVSFLLRENWIKKGNKFTTVHLLGRELRTEPTGRRASRRTRIRLEFTTTVTGSPQITTEWNLSGQFNVRTQLAPGYAERRHYGRYSYIQPFGAPIYGQFSLGM